jgi:nitrile hydratase
VTAAAPRFAVGDRVRVRAAHAQGHCRTPFYLRGKRGVVTRLLGTYRNPEELAYHRPGTPRQPLYQVDFDFAEVWGRADRGVRITADIYQHWLEADA